MYNISSRANQVFFFTIIVLTILGGINHLSSYVLQPKENPHVEFNVKNILRLFQRDGYKWDQCHLTFDFTADLRSLYNWNVKQLFVYVQVDFTDSFEKKNSTNIIFDQIIKRQGYESEGVFQFTDRKMKYPLRDIYNNLAGQKVKISVWTQIMPSLGYIRRIKIYDTVHTLPGYTK